MKKILAKVIKMDQQIAFKYIPYIINFFSFNEEIFYILVSINDSYWTITSKIIQRLEQ